jgi:PAS domain S-box-containing protein
MSRAPAHEGDQSKAAVTDRRGRTLAGTWLAARLAAGLLGTSLAADAADAADAAGGNASAVVGRPDGTSAIVEGPVQSLHLVALTGLGLAGLGGLYSGLRSNRGRGGDGSRNPQEERTRRTRPVRAAFENLPLPAMGVDPTGQVLWVNRSLLELSGQSVETVTLRPWWQAFPHSAPTAHATGGTPPVRVEAEDLPCPDGPLPLHAVSGSCRTIHWRSSAVHDEVGHLTGFSCVGEDVTDRLRGEELRARSEVRLRESEARFRALFESMVDASASQELVLDASGAAVDYRFQTVNAGFENLTGQPAASLVGRLVSEVLGPPDPHWLTAFRQVSELGEPMRFCRPFPGTERWFEVAAFSTGPRQVGTVFFEITDWMRDRESLQRKDAELEAIFEYAPVIMFLVTEEGSLRRVNRAALEHFGLGAEEAIKRFPGELIACANSAGEPRGCGTRQDCEGCELHRVIVDSRERGVVHRREEVRLPMMREGVRQEATLLVSTSPMHLGGRVMVLVSLEDISAARAAEERLREQAMLLATAHDAIYVLDLDGRIRFWNKGAERMYGWLPTEALGKEASDVVFGGSRPMWANVRQLVLDEGHWDGELLQCHRNSQQLIVEARASLVRDSRGQPKSVLMVATDLTEKKQMERQLMRAQRLESLGTMACGIAHDLNNVLTPVQMVVDLLRPSVAGSDGERFLDLLNRSARRGADIIKQLLLFGRGAESSRSEIDLRYLLKETVKILRETFPKSIQVRLDLPNELWSVVGDVTQLHQVLLNLCVNARDAMPKGGALVLSVENIQFDDKSARAIAEAKPGKYVVVQVSDSGTGIPPEVLDRIFDPFFTTKPLGQGTGLGLSTVQGIVRSHGGFIQVVTKSGSGSQFRVHLPLGTDPTPAPKPVAVVAEASGAERWVLVVDDEDVIRELLRSALERSGYRVILAGDGAEAISVFGRRHGEISAVVIDMMMPFIDGAGAITMFRKIKPAISILAISGLPGQRDEAEKAGGGRISFLLKPFVVRELVAELTRCIHEETRPDDGLVRMTDD